MTHHEIMFTWREPIGLISDAHGNPYALVRILQELTRRQVHRIFFLGDAVGYLPGGAEVLRLLIEGNITCVKGNHDAMLLGERPCEEELDAIYRLNDTKALLPNHFLEVMRAWPEKIILVDEKTRRRAMLVHGGPKEPLDEYIYADTDLTYFDELSVDYIFIGQTHRPFIRNFGKTIVANVGSCGLPRDVGNLASGAIFNPTSGSVEIIRREFDVNEMVKIYGGKDSIHPLVLEVLQRT